MKIEAGNFAECLAQIAERGRLSESEALVLLQQVSDRAETMRETGIADPNVTAAGELATKLRQEAQLNRLDALRNASKRQRLFDLVVRSGGIHRAPQTVFGRLFRLENMTQAELTMRSEMHGTNLGTRDNVESRWRGNANLWQAKLSRAIEKIGVARALVSGDLDSDVSAEWWRINAGQEPEHAGSPAHLVAQAFAKILDFIRDRLNEAGARIGDATDFVTHTDHDPAKMRRAAGPGASYDDAFAAWRDAILPELHPRTFDVLDEEVPTGEFDLTDPDAARNRFLRSIFDALVSGVHLRYGGREDGAFVAPAFEGTGNLGRRISQSRVLFWKDGRAWQRYQNRFGSSPNLLSSVMGSIDRGARQIALMEKFGTNPPANLDLILRKIDEQYRGDFDQLARWKPAHARLRAVMAQLDGSANWPAHQRISQIMAAVRTWDSMSDLGGLGITHGASVLATLPSEIVHHGIPRLSALGELMHSFVRGKGDDERRDVLADLGAFAHGLNREIFARWQAEDPIPGHISTLASRYFKYTGIHYIFDRSQAATRWMLAHQLGRYSDREFASLGQPLSQMLAKYRIGREEWNLLRQVADLPEAEGMRFLTPDAAMRTEPAAVEALLRGRGELRVTRPEPPQPDLPAPVAPEIRQDYEAAAAHAEEQIGRAVRHFQWEMSDRLASYYNDAAVHAVVTPGVRERAALLGGTTPGSPLGEIGRFLFQFKMWPAAAMTQVLGRDIWLSAGRRNFAWGLGTLLSMTTLAGYFRMTVNDLALGNTPRDPRSPATLLAALSQGGGIGILGDFLFGNMRTSRFGSDLFGTLSGPVAGDASTLWNLFTRFRADSLGMNPSTRGPFHDIWPELARFGVRHIPFLNLIYVKGALDYLLWYHLYDTVDPGWWERANRRMEREQGRHMAGYLPGAGVPYGVPGIALSGPR